MSKHHCWKYNKGFEFICATCGQSANAEEALHATACSTPVLADVLLPTYCGCNELLENIEQLEAHAERGCWRKV